jgi:hypothetical protein
MNHLLRPWIWPSFLASSGAPSQAQDKLTLRRTVQVRLGSNPAVPQDGCLVARPSNSRSLRSAQSRKRVPSFTVS